jgi:hypothetical protein
MPVGLSHAGVVGTGNATSAAGRPVIRLAPLPAGHRPWPAETSAPAPAVRFDDPGEPENPGA